MLGGELAQAIIRDPSPTELALEALKNANQNLGSAIKRLEDKLTAVLVPTTPQPSTGRPFPESGALLPQTITQEARTLDEYANAIMALLDRCVL